MTPNQMMMPGMMMAPNGMMYPSDPMIWMNQAYQQPIMPPPK